MEREFTGQGLCLSWGCNDLCTSIQDCSWQAPRRWSIGMCWINKCQFRQAREARIKLDGRACCRPATPGLGPQVCLGVGVSKGKDRAGQRELRLRSENQAPHRDIWRWLLRGHNSTPYPVGHFTLPARLYAKIPTPCVSNTRGTAPCPISCEWGEHIHAGVNVVWLMSGGRRDDHKHVFPRSLQSSALPGLAGKQSSQMSGSP